VPTDWVPGDGPAEEQAPTAPITPTNTKGRIWRRQRPQIPRLPNTGTPQISVRDIDDIAAQPSTGAYAARLRRAIASWT
jgi:hypothetical protein